MFKKQSNKYKDWIFISWIFFIAIYALRPIEAYDTFWQLQSGKYIWQTGHFIYKDIFSLASDVYRMEHCWLHDIVLYVFYVVGSYELLTLFKPITVLLCVIILYRWSTEIRVQSHYLLPALTLCVVASEASWLIRPQLWTFIFSVLYLYLLLRGRETGIKAWGWLVPIMLLWANVHAGCVFGFVLIGFFWLGELLRYFQKKVHLKNLISLAVIGLLTFGIAFINPYGARIPLGQLLAHINQHKVLTGDAPIGMLGNMEWLPPTFAQVPWFYVIMVLWGGLILWRLRRLDPAEGIFFLAFLYMGLSQIRHTTLVALLAGFFLPGAIQQLGQAVSERWSRFSKVFSYGRQVAVVALLVLITSSGVRGELGLGLKAYEYPVAAADFVLENNLPRQLYNSYDWGGYLMWRLYPKHLVFVDGRSDSIEHFNASSRIDNRWEGWREELDKYNINTIVTRTCYYDTGEPLNLIDGLAASRDWQLVFSDATALVYLRVRPEYREFLAEHARLAVDAYRTQLAEATRLYEAAPDSRPLALLAIGRAAMKTAQWARARQAYERYLELVPGHREATNALRLLSTVQQS